MVCPICGQEAKTPRGLRKHMMGTRPYGGHELTVSEATFAAATVSAQPDLSHGDADAYLAEALQRLVANKQLPKYEFERAVDAFLGVFLPDIVSWALGEGGSVQLVAQEFPLKKKESNQSTNVDYVLHSSAPGDRPWVFLELKTDTSSANDAQARIYAERLDDTTMEELLTEVVAIQGVSKKSEKYAALLERFEPHRPIVGLVRVVYLTPKPQDASSLLPKSSPPELVEKFGHMLTCRSFPELLTVDLTTHPQAWALFRGGARAERWLVSPGLGGLRRLRGLAEDAIVSAWVSRLHRCS